MMLEAIRQRVMQECLRDQNVLGSSFFDQHVEVVAHYGVELAARLGADAEIVALAAYLHDISAVRDVSTLPSHAIVSAEIAREVLTEAGYPAHLAERVAQCIRTHSAPVAAGGGTAEEICVSNADAIAQVVRPVFWCYFIFGFRKMSFEDGRRWLRERVEANWANLVQPARELASEGYELSRSVLQDFEHPLTRC